MRVETYRQSQGQRLHHSPTMMLHTYTPSAGIVYRYLSIYAKYTDIDNVGYNNNIGTST